LENENAIHGSERRRMPYGEGKCIQRMEIFYGGISFFYFPARKSKKSNAKIPRIITNILTAHLISIFFCRNSRNASLKGEVKLENLKNVASDLMLIA
jgi:hypothetical protein